jgi:hypothetical protein
VEREGTWIRHNDVERIASLVDDRRRVARDIDQPS